MLLLHSHAQARICICRVIYLPSKVPKSGTRTGQTKYRRLFACQSCASSDSRRRGVTAWPRGGVMGRQPLENKGWCFGL